MPSDIRSFFGGKGTAPAPKPKNEDDSSKSRRSKGRKVVDDSDDDAPIIDNKKTTKATPKKKASEAESVQGVAMSATDYFASSNGKGQKYQTTPKATAKTQLKPQVTVRVSPRTKQTPARKAEDPVIKKEAKDPGNPVVKKEAKSTRKKPVVSYHEHDDDDEDAFMDDEEDGDDIFAAAVKGRRKRKNDDYKEDESEEEDLPKPKRVASRGRPSTRKDLSDEEDVKPAVAKNARNAKNGASTGAGNRKRKILDEDEDEEDTVPRKKTTTTKPQAPKVKKEAPAENADYQAILDGCPLIEPPEPPAKDPNAKFDWRKAAGGANAGPPPNAGASEVPEGEENCLVGLSFVFTGLLKTLGREEGQALVKRYGGKVTGAPSGKTDYVVLGDDAGPSKLAKIRDNSIKTIDENGLFYLIRNLPANGGHGQNAQKALQKQEEAQDKIRQQAAEMEKEDKARESEAEKARKAAAARGAPAAPPPPPATSQLWTTKYAPTQLSHICGNKGNVEKIQAWLKNWPKAKMYDFKNGGPNGMGLFRAIIISGPPGIGKTTAAHLAAKLEGYDILESNASDTRSKKLVESGVADVLNNTSLLGFFAGDGKKVDAAKKKIVLIMDEVDGMSAGDRGGVVALSKFCKKTEVPLILICNDRRLPKMKPFDFVTYDIKFTRPTVEQIRSRIMTICHREGLKLPPNVVDALIEGSNKDIRQIINMISTAKLDQTAMDFNQGKAMTKAWEKHIVLKPWDICQKMIAGGLFAPASTATLNDKIELYFNDHEFSFLMIQENYLRSKPSLLTNKGYNSKEENLKWLELVDEAAESISDGDLVDRMIHGPQQHWSLMPTHAIFSTVRPSSCITGQLLGSNFTSWLGNNSKTGKLGRYVREIHAHMRLKCSGDHNEIRQQYLPVLWYQLVKRFEVEGKEAVEDIINMMDSYYLTREDWDAIKELGVGEFSEERVKFESQAKAAFTRMYNSMSHPVPFMKASNILASKKTARSAPDLEEAIEEEDDGAALDANEVDEDEDMDIKGDKYIKQPKSKGGKKTVKKATKAIGDDDDDVVTVDVGKATVKGKSKGKPTGGRGKAKK